jgi:sugar phosphate isomerase/epimerase
MNKLALAPTTLPDTPALDYVEAAHAGGYDLVGLRLIRSPGLPFHPVLGDAPLIRDLKRRLADTGLGVFDIFSCYLKPDTRLDDFWPALELGAELGGKYVMLMGDDADAARLEDNFVAFCAGAARVGLAAAIEFAPMRPLASLAQTVALIRKTGVVNAVVCLDPLSLARCGEGPADLRAVDPRLFPYTQITDGVLALGEPDPATWGKAPPSQRRNLGEGTVPLREILAALPQGLPLSVEIPPPTKTIAARDWARQTCEATRRFVAGQA